MKRKCFDSCTKPRSSIPTSQQREMRLGKRVKFKDTEVDNLRKFRSDSSSISLRSSRKSHEAKTSEFAFFKKLKEVSGQKFTSNEQIEQSNKFGLGETSNLIKSTSFSDKINSVDEGLKDFRSSFQVENATPVRFVSVKPPRGGFDTPKHSTGKSDLTPIIKIAEMVSRVFDTSSFILYIDSNLKKACWTVEDMHRTQKESEGYGHASKTEGIRRGNEENFNKKRQKLHLWVTETSFPEIEGLGLKGSDIVSKLLSRLIPESKENNNVENKSDILREELQLARSRDLTELEFRPNLDDILNRHHNCSGEKIHHLDDLLNHDNKTNHRYEGWESDTKIHRPTESIEEIEGGLHQNRYSFSNHSNNRVLDWAFDTMDVGKNLSITFPDREPIDDIFDGHRLLPLPSVQITKESEILLPNLASHHGSDFGIPLLEEKECIRLPSPNSNHLALSCQKSYFSPVKEHYNETSFHNRDQWLISETFSPKTDSLISPSGLFLGLDWKCFHIGGVPRELCSSSYRAFEYPTNLSLSHCLNANNEFENCEDGSCHKGTVACFSGEAVDNVGFRDWSLSRPKKEIWEV